MIGWITGLHADVDFKDHSLAPEEIRQRIDQTLLRASLVVSTGGGLHCYWLFREAETATPEMVTRVEAALRWLADHVGGDLQCAECSRLMRVPGTTNYKRETPFAVQVIRERPAARYELVELEEWLAEAHPLLERRSKQANGKGNSADTDTPFGAYAEGGAAPIDIEARLTAMRFQGEGEASVHLTQVQVTAALLERGEDIDPVVAKVLAATRAVGDPQWNWTKEERDIRHMCESWLKKRQPQAKGAASAVVSIDDFVSYLPAHSYIFVPTREPWPASSVSVRLPPVAAGNKLMPASKWLDRNRPVEQMTGRRASRCWCAIASWPTADGSNARA
jgi:hypothetical protein